MEQEENNISYNPKTHHYLQYKKEQHQFFLTQNFVLITYNLTIQTLDLLYLILFLEDVKVYQIIISVILLIIHLTGFILKLVNYNANQQDSQKLDIFIETTIFIQIFSLSILPQGLFQNQIIKGFFISTLSFLYFQNQIRNANYSIIQFKMIIFLNIICQIFIQYNIFDYDEVNKDNEITVIEILILLTTLIPFSIQKYQKQQIFNYTDISILTLYEKIDYIHNVLHTLPINMLCAQYNKIGNELDFIYSSNFVKEYLCIQNSEDMQEYFKEIKVSMYQKNNNQQQYNSQQFKTTQSQNISPLMRKKKETLLQSEFQQEFNNNNDNQNENNVIQLNQVLTNKQLSQPNNSYKISLNNSPVQKKKSSQKSHSLAIIDQNIAKINSSYQSPQQQIIHEKAGINSNGDTLREISGSNKNENNYNINIINKENNNSKNFILENSGKLDQNQLNNNQATERDSNSLKNKAEVDVDQSYSVLNPKLTQENSQNNSIDNNIKKHSKLIVNHNDTSKNSHQIIKLQEVEFSVKSKNEQNQNTYRNPDTPEIDNQNQNQQQEENKIINEKLPNISDSSSSSNDDEDNFSEDNRMVFSDYIKLLIQKKIDHFQNKGLITDNHRDSFGQRQSLFSKRGSQRASVLNFQFSLGSIAQGMMHSQNLQNIDITQNILQNKSRASSNINRFQQQKQQQNNKMYNSFCYNNNNQQMQNINFNTPNQLKSFQNNFSPQNASGNINNNNLVPSPIKKKSLFNKVTYNQYPEKINQQSQLYEQLSQTNLMYSQFNQIEKKDEKKELKRLVPDVIYGENKNGQQWQIKIQVNILDTNTMQLFIFFHDLNPNSNSSLKKPTFTFNSPLQKQQQLLRTQQQNKLKNSQQFQFGQKQQQQKIQQNNILENNLAQNKAQLHSIIMNQSQKKIKSLLQKNYIDNQQQLELQILMTNMQLSSLHFYPQKTIFQKKKLQEFNIYDEIEEIRQFFIQKINANIKQIKLNVDVNNKSKNQVINVKSDLNLIKTLVYNILENACKNCANKGEINIQLQEVEDTYVQISVSNKLSIFSQQNINTQYFNCFSTEDYYIRYLYTTMQSSPSKDSYLPMGLVNSTEIIKITGNKEALTFEIDQQNKEITVTAVIFKDLKKQRNQTPLFNKPRNSSMYSTIKKNSIHQIQSSFYNIQFNNNNNTSHNMQTGSQSTVHNNKPYINQTPQNAQKIHQSIYQYNTRQSQSQVYFEEDKDINKLSNALKRDSQTNGQTQNQAQSTLSNQYQLEKIEIQQSMPVSANFINNNNLQKKKNSNMQQFQLENVDEEMEDIVKDQKNTINKYISSQKNLMQAFDQ